jgi:hypothetical protein
VTHFQKANLYISGNSSISFWCHLHREVCRQTRANTAQNECHVHNLKTHIHRCDYTIQSQYKLDMFSINWNQCMYVVLYILKTILIYSWHQNLWHESVMFTPQEFAWLTW